MNIAALRVLQAQLRARGAQPATVDGRMCAATRAAIASTLTRLDPGTASDWRAWPLARRDVLCLQVLCCEAGLDPGRLDGWWGPQTEYACGQLAHLQAHGELPPPWRDRFPVPANPNGWPLERQADLVARYGKPGANLVTVELPYPLRLAWDTATRITRTQCNAVVRDSLHRVLTRVRRRYGLEGIAQLRLDVYGGGFNLRDKRGGTTLSTHAWGIAFDFDPMHNKLAWGRDRATLAQPEYDDWWRSWEAEGWVSLGRTRNYDWMHVQAARV